MNRAERRVDILVCTFRRTSVADTLRSLDEQRLPPGVRLRAIVADNDEGPSGRDAVEGAARGLSLPVVYLHAPARNISIARNAGLAASDADWVGFIDDDETAAPEWLMRLMACADAAGADAVFGPSIAEYSDTVPDWMRRQDHHSNRPVRRGRTVETGHTCNALLRWGNAPWRQVRFDEERGRSGGEDTAFFFALHRAGARFEICDGARVYERVEPHRATLAWLMRRKYRSGQSHAARATGPIARVLLAGSAGAKSAVCGLAALVWIGSEDRRNFWVLRGAMHLGVIAGCLALRQPQIYGSSTKP